MKLQQVIQLAINTSESGMPGAAVEILIALNESLVVGNDPTGEFFKTFDEDGEMLVIMAQKIAFDKEAVRKGRIPERYPKSPEIDRGSIA